LLKVIEIHVLMYYTRAMLTMVGSVLLAFLSVSEALSLSLRRQPSFVADCSSCIPPELMAHNILFATGMGLNDNGPYKGFEKRKESSLEPMNLTCKQISVYGAYVMKIPDWFVDQMKAAQVRLGNAKTHNYNFVGSQGFKARVGGGDSSYQLRRDWVPEFAKEHFEGDDILYIKDAPEQYIPVGSFDLSTEEWSHKKISNPDKIITDGYCQDDCWDYEASYFDTLIQSNFTLCPGGDSAWSMRFYEAILAGSIPVITNVENDLSGPAFWWNQIGYTYFTEDQVVNISSTKSSADLKNIADANYELFITYQTWLRGDQVPPAYAAYSGPCLSDDTCKHDCLDNTW